MHEKIEFAPYAGNLLEHCLHLAAGANVKRHHNRSLKRLRQRLNIFFGFVVQVSHSELGAQGSKCLCATPGDRLVVGNSDDQPFLALKKSGFHSW